MANHQHKKWHRYKIVNLKTYFGVVSGLFEFIEGLVRHFVTKIKYLKKIAELIHQACF